jgi:multidrug resistance efflux pump
VELEKLDMSIDKNVVILRDKIETMAVEVAQAQIQLTKKEKEYMQAKQLYEKKLTEKEMLSDHLNLIIFENEKQKELKFSDMLEKLHGSEN